ncbi:MAG: 4Fe-4S dicluster domain-containing protein [Acidobacteria bacterium]|nr:4Fe-4S dicluster domain-containing protein [Acidobacteriota bacterium]
MSGAGFVLDLHRCVGCGACVLACRVENGRVESEAWRRVLPLNLRRQPGGPTYFLSVACHHCEEPACLNGCPSGAYEKRADGIVVHHEARCLGCRYCEMTCPFGTPRFEAHRGVVSKCHLCAHRIDDGREPACVAACPTEALRFAPASGADEGDARPAVPGFVDPAGCRPSLRFVPPKGAVRDGLFQALEKRMRR